MLQDIVSLFLFIIPGAMAIITRDIVLGPGAPRESDFDKTVASVICSIPISSATWLLLRGLDWYRVFQMRLPSWQLTGIQSFNAWVLSWPWMLVHVVASWVIAVFTGVLLAAQAERNSFWMKAVNRVRRSFGKPDLTGSATLWTMLSDMKHAEVVSVHGADGTELVKGFLVSTSDGGHHRELRIGEFDVLTKYRGYFEEVAQTYVDLDLGWVVKLYDMTQFKEAINELGHGRPTAS